MPEGPELHLASLFVNRMCEGVVFTGPVKKSEVSKSPDVPFTCEAYRIAATSRGKEVRLTLTPLKRDDHSQGPRVEAGSADQPMDVIFRFGMSGFFRFTIINELPKHSHLQFSTNEEPCRVLSFVDARRFGSWQPNGTWQADRGPCIMLEYELFRENVLSHLSDKAFNRPICEALLNQKYFNGIGNYLRAEILFRLEIPPFVQARTVLEGIQSKDEWGEDEKPTKEEIKDIKITVQAVTKAKCKTPDLLSLCHAVPLEVINLGGKGYDPEKADHSDFQAWLQCYYVDGMKSIRDHNGRTMWFKGDPGPMAPKNSKAKKRVKKESDHEYTEKKTGAKKPSAVEPEMVKKEEGVLLTQKGPKRKLVQNGKDDGTTLGKQKLAARRKGSSTDTSTGPQRQSVRITRQSSKLSPAMKTGQ